MADTIKVTSPIDDSLVGELPAMSRGDIDKAYEGLQNVQPEWAAKPVAERAEQVSLIAKVLRDYVDELADTLVMEIGKTPQEARDEITRTADLVDATVAAATALKPERIAAEDFPNTPAGRSQLVERVPLGVILAISPFNYPVNLAVSKIAPALVMGNTVMFKSSTRGGITARRLVELCGQAGLASPVLHFASGQSSEIGDYLVTHPAVSGVAMTGSTDVGQHIAAQTGMVPLLLELGGNDAAIVLAGADLGLAAEAIAKGAFKYAGQRCTAVKRVYVSAAVAEEFTEKLVAQVDQHFGSAGDPREHPVGPVIDDKQADFLQGLLDDALANGGKVARGGQRDGRVFEATVVTGLPHQARLVCEEQFGPILPVVAIKDQAEAVTLANDSRYGLQASVFTDNRQVAEAVAAQLDVGGVHLNGPDQRGPDNFMFTGSKESGLGSQGIRFALEAFSKQKGHVYNDEQWLPGR